MNWISLLITLKEKMNKKGAAVMAALFLCHFPLSESLEPMFPGGIRVLDALCGPVAA